MGSCRTCAGLIHFPSEVWSGHRGSESRAQEHGAKVIYFMLDVAINKTFSKTGQND